MAIIPNNQKILTSSADVDTTYGGPTSLKEMNTWYTMQDIKDSTGGLPYKVYSANITTSFTASVNVTVLENTIGNINWITTTGADAIGELTGEFLSNKTWVIASTSRLPGTEYVNITRLNNNQIKVERFDKFGGESELTNVSIEIRVYN